MDQESLTVQVHPNPIRAHGAWVYLCASIGAGAIVGADRGIELPLLVGTGYIGAFRMMAALSVGSLRQGGQFLFGASLATLASFAAYWLSADPRFLAIEALAVLPGAATILLEKKLGFLARATLVTGLASLALAAPAAAVAGGATAARGAMLFALLWPYFCWRTLRIAAPLRAGVRWDRVQLKRRGLREAAYAAVWSIAVAVTLRVTG